VSGPAGVSTWRRGRFDESGPADAVYELGPARGAITFGNGVNGAAWLWVVLGLLFDLGLHGSGFYSNRPRVRRYRTSQSA